MSKLKASLDERMAARHGALRDKWDSNRREIEGESGSVTTAAGAFWDAFNAEKLAVEASADSLERRYKHMEAKEIGEAIDDLVKRANGLQERTSAHTHELPKYDVKRALTESEEVRATVERIRGTVLPRKKFSFARRRNRDKEPSEKPKTSGPSASGASQQRSQSLAEDLAATHSFVSQSNALLTVAPGQLRGTRGSDYFIKECNGCTIVLMDTLSALKMEGLTNCRVFAGPVAGSTFARNMRNCDVFLAGRQLRIHDSENCRWFVRTASGPIIEDCTGMGFAPYCLSYPELEGQLQSSGLASVPDGAWSDVKDFKWHRAQASPNWSVIPEDQRPVILPPESLRDSLRNTLDTAPKLTSTSSSTRTETEGQGETRQGQEDDGDGDDEEDEL